MTRIYEGDFFRINQKLKLYYKQKPWLKVIEIKPSREKLRLQSPETRQNSMLAYEIKALRVLAKWVENTVNPISTTRASPGSDYAFQFISRTK